MNKTNFLTTKYFFLFIALLCLLLISPQLEILEFGDWMLNSFFFLILISVVYAVRHSKRHVIIAIVLIFTVLVTDILGYYFKSPTLSAISAGTNLSFLCFAIWIIFIDVFTTKNITLDTVFGSISIYFLLAIAYGLVYIIIQIFNPDSFRYAIAIHETVKLTPAELIYFSFITLTTVGYGDIYAISSYAKTVSMLEGTTGVLYLAVFVAKLLSEFKRDKD